MKYCFFLFSLDIGNRFGNSIVFVRNFFVTQKDDDDDELILWPN